MNRKDPHDAPRYPVGHEDFTAMTILKTLSSTVVIDRKGL